VQAFLHAWTHVSPRPGVGVLYSRKTSTVGIFTPECCDAGVQVKMREREEEYVYAEFVYGSKSFIRTYAFCDWPNQCNLPKQKKRPQKYPAMSDIATVSDGYQTVLHRE
jgi:hypothetical protein